MYADDNAIAFVPILKVDFDADGGSDVPFEYAIQGGAIGKPADPTKDGFAFAGWYPTEGLDTDPVAFPYTVTGAATFYAKWVLATPTPSPDPTPTQGENPPTGDPTGPVAPLALGLALAALLGLALLRPRTGASRNA